MIAPPCPIGNWQRWNSRSAESAGIHYWWLLQMARYPANLSFHHHFIKITQIARYPANLSFHHHFITITQITISSRQKNKSFIWSSLSSQFSTLKSPSLHCIVQQMYNCKGTKVPLFTNVSPFKFSPLYSELTSPRIPSYPTSSFSNHKILNCV